MAGALCWKVGRSGGGPGRFAAAGGAGGRTGLGGLPARHLQAAQGEPVQRFCFAAAAYSSPLREAN